MIFTKQLNNELTQLKNFDGCRIISSESAELNPASLESADTPYRFLIVSGPSGVGKSQLVSVLLRYFSDNIEWVVLQRVSSRKSRMSDTVQEIQSISLDEFTKLASDGELLYSEYYIGNSSWYGLKMSQIKKAISTHRRGVFILFGTIALMDLLPQCCYVYLLPPSLPELEHRLKMSDKPNRNVLLNYGVQEMQKLIQKSDQLNEIYPISIICWETNEEEKCARKIVDFMVHGEQYLEIPLNLVAEIERYLQ